MHHGRSVAVRDETKRGHDRVGALGEVVEVVGEQLVFRRGVFVVAFGVPGKNFVHIHGCLGVRAGTGDFGEQREVVDRDGIDPGKRARAFQPHLRVGAEVDHVPQADGVDQVGHVGRREVLQVVGSEDLSESGSAAVHGRQPAEIANVDRARQIDPPAAGGQSSGAIMLGPLAC